MAVDDLAVGELVAAITWGQLEAYAAAVSAVVLAPDVADAEELARMSRAEYDEYRRLRDHLDELTDLPEALLERRRGDFHAFFEGATDHGWDHACAVLAFGWSVARDFLTMIAPRLPEATRAVVEAVVVDRDIQRFALDQLRGRITGPEQRARMRSTIATLVGRALAGYQEAVGDSDALAIVLGDESAGGDEARRLAIDIMANHHRRLAALGIDEPE